MGVRSAVLLSLQHQTSKSLLPLTPANPYNILQLQISLQNVTGAFGSDINFTAAAITPRNDPLCAQQQCGNATMGVSAVFGVIAIPELPTSERVAVASVWSEWPSSVSVPPHTNVTLLGLQVVVTSLNSSGKPVFGTRRSFSIYS